MLAGIVVLTMFAPRILPRPYFEKVDKILARIFDLPSSISETIHNTTLSRTHIDDAERC